MCYKWLQNQQYSDLLYEVKLISGEIHERTITIDKKHDSFVIADKVKHVINKPRVYVNLILHPNIKYKIIKKNIVLDNEIEIKNNNYDAKVIEKVPYSEDWGLFDNTNRISFIKEHYNENDELKITINEL